MNWKSIRLELGQTREFPNGSASRAYLLRLPLTAEGAIDVATLDRTPEQATVRRLWPSEPDLSGHAVRRDGKLAFIARQGAAGEAFSEFDARPFNEGTILTILERGGRLLPFRVAELRAAR
ncbi:hypothetical protein OMW55_08870 [Sphingomonas sp. BN140010]|uniref:Uncharacterized protein n=1 Tax=Sphingomonas arvum TaxID=2992113 RepID=A0ABT3JG62_9SPHN|nr:hypothetical protein [Sphingomonas sp. BN140010]MCW3797914.1 hypothetical protein [Sphingomonas sp. BN140010]